jgi:cytochrome b561
METLMVRNSTASWGWPAKWLHWIAAIAIILLLGHGWWMTHMTARPERMANYMGHAALGYDLLVLLVLRLLWHWVNPVPALPSELKPWERIAARAGHIGLYLLMFAASLTGWALAGTFRSPINKDIFGLAVPQIVQDRGYHKLFEESHMILSYLLAALIVVHFAGALRHHFFKHNDVLRRMWFGGRPLAQDATWSPPSPTAGRTN